LQQLVDDDQGLESLNLVCQDRKSSETVPHR